MSAKVYKTVFRFIRGKLRPINVPIPEQHVKNFQSGIKKAARAINQSVRAEVKRHGGEPPTIHRVISAKGRGIAFVKKDGKIVPVRKK